METKQRESFYKRKSSTVDRFDFPESINRDSRGRSLSLKDFAITSSLGSGAYGEVFLVRRKADNKKYAMKIIDKEFMIKLNKEYQITAEKEILMSLSHAGVVRLHYVFQDKKRIYLVLDFVSGGSFANHLKSQKGSLKPETAKIHAAEIVSILEYLHQNRVVHGDIKPENLMLTEEGHLKAIDFGTAKYFKPERRSLGAMSKDKIDLENNPLETTSTFDGTALYVAPELLEDNECSAPADLWALGCIIFLMTTGETPFNAINEYLLFQEIKQINIRWPKEMDPVARDLIEKLLCRNPKERLGAGPEGSDNDYNALKSHPYFKGISFETLFDPDSFILSPGPAKRKASTVGDLDEELRSSSLDKPRSMKLDLDEEKKNLGFTDFLARSSVFINPDKKQPNVLLAGRVEKKSRYIFYQLRQLVITDEPCIKYIDPATNQIRKEIPVNSTTVAKLESKSKFFIITPSRKFTFKSLDHPAQKWVDAINELCKSSV